MALICEVKRWEDNLLPLLEENLLKFSVKLRKFKAIPADVLEVFSSLDLRVESPIRVRFLMQHVYQEILKSNESPDGFLNAVSEVSEGASRVCEKIKQGLKGLVKEKVKDVGCERAGSKKHDIGFTESRRHVLADHVLSHRDIQKLVKGFTGLAHRWEEVGKALNLPKSVLVKCKACRSNTRKISKVLYEWVRGNHKNALRPTYCTLKDALHTKLCSKWISRDMEAKIFSHVEARKVVIIEEHHIPQLMENLTEIAHMWKEIGVSVGLPEDVLQECGRGNNDLLRLHKILYRWITRAFERALLPSFDNLRVLQNLGYQAGLMFKALKTQSRKSPSIMSIGPLSENHIPSLLEHLAEVAYKWEEIGIALGMPMKEIYNHTGKYSDNLMRLYKVICSWIAGEFPNCVPATFICLEKALCRRFLGLNVIAKSLYDISEEKIKATSLKTSLEVKDGWSTLLEATITSDKSSVAYQWFRNGLPLSDGGVYMGVKRSILAIVFASQGTEGVYSCELSNDGQVKHFEAITVKVNYPPLKNHLLSFYFGHRSDIPYNTWPMKSTKEYIDLSLIEKPGNTCFTVKGDLDDILRREVVFAYNKVFMEYEKGKILFLVGRPGSGKTTLTFKLARDWAINGNVLRHAKMVFYVSFHLLKTEKSLLSILSYIYGREEELKEMLEDIARSGGEGICLVLDSLDEYLSKDDKESEIYQILHKAFLPNAMVIVTSQCMANSKEYGNSCIEVMGFTRQHIVEFINKYPFELDKPQCQIFSNLCSCFNMYPNIWNICYLPLHVAIVCQFFQQRKSLPVTETEIVSAIVSSVISRVLHVNESSEMKPIISLKKLPDNISDYFKDICRLAFNMTVESKETMSSNDFKKEKLSDTADGTYLGLISTQHCIDNLSEFKLHHGFSHVTLQEFLAASHIASLQEADQDKLINAYGDKLQMRRVWKFYFGTVLFNKKSVLFERFICSHKLDQKYLFQCAFESQQAEVYEAVAKYCHSEVNLKGSMTSLEIESILNILSSTIEPKFILKVSLCHLSFDAVKALADGLKCNKSIKALNFSNNSTLFSDGAVWLSEALKHNQIIQSLKISGCELSSKSIINLAERLKDLHNIQEIDISMNNIDMDEALVLSDTIKRVQSLNFSHNYMSIQCAKRLANVLHHNHIQELDLSWNDMGPWGVAALADGLKFNNNLRILNLSHNNITFCSALPLERILISNKGIQLLDLSANNIGSAGCTVVGYLLKQSSTIETLLLSQNNIGSGGAQKISDGFMYNNSIKTLDLSQNIFGSEGVISLSSVIKLNNSLLTLNLSQNLIGFEGILALADSLLYNCTLQELDLSWNNVGLHGAEYLTDVLMKGETMVFLNLRHTEMGFEGMQALANKFSLNSSIQKLNISMNSVANCDTVEFKDYNIFRNFHHIQELDVSMSCITSYGVAALADMLMTSSEMKVLTLSNNYIGLYGVTMLANGLMQNHSLQHLDLSWNSIGSDGAKVLANVLKKNRRIQILNLSQNNITSGGASAIADGIEQCPAIKNIDLSGNSIGSDGALALVDALRKSPNVQFLNLSHNSIHSKGMMVLSRQLDYMTSLQTVDLSCNKTDDITFGNKLFYRPNNSSYEIQVKTKEEYYFKPAFGLLSDKHSKEIIEGFNAVGETTFTCQEKPTMFDWEGYGLKLIFNGNVAPQAITFSFLAAISGDFNFPDKTELVSGVYHITSSPESKPPVAMIQIQHCVASKHIGSLSFVASYDQHPPYKFQYIDGGFFNSRYGVIEVKSLSTWALIYRHGISGVLSLFEKNYLASLHQSPRPEHSSDGALWTYYVSIIKNCAIFQTCLKTYCNENGRFHCSDVSFQFAKQAIKIVLDIEQEDNEQEGISISFMCNSFILKSEIDNYVEGRPPQVRLNVVVVKKEEIPFFQFSISINGAKEANVFIRWHQLVSTRMFLSAL